MKRVVSVMAAELFSNRDCLYLTDEVLYGHEVTVLESFGDVLLVKTEEGHEGFASASDFSACEITDAPWRVAYRTDVLSARDITARKLFVLPRFARVCVLGREGDFFRVRLFDLREGFVHANHLLPPLVLPPSTEEIVSTALSLLGVPYRYGGRSAVALDCSGLVSLAFSFHGVTLPRNTGELHSLPEVEQHLCRRGDLILFDSHVGIALTRTTFLHASASMGFVAVSSLQKSHPLFDSVHVPHGFTVRRVL